MLEGITMFSKHRLELLAFLLLPCASKAPQGYQNLARNPSFLHRKPKSCTPGVLRARRGVFQNRENHRHPRSGDERGSLAAGARADAEGSPAGALRRA